MPREIHAKMTLMNAQYAQRKSFFQNGIINQQEYAEHLQRLSARNQKFRDLLQTRLDLPKKEWEALSLLSSVLGEKLLKQWGRHALQQSVFLPQPQGAPVHNTQPLPPYVYTPSPLAPAERSGKEDLCAWRAIQRQLERGSNDSAVAALAQLPDAALNRLAFHMWKTKPGNGGDYGKEVLLDRHQHVRATPQEKARAVSAYIAEVETAIREAQQRCLTDWSRGASQTAFETLCETLVTLFYGEGKFQVQRTSSQNRYALFLTYQQAYPKIIPYLDAAFKACSEGEKGKNVPRSLYQERKEYLQQVYRDTEQFVNEQIPLPSPSATLYSGKPHKKLQVPLYASTETVVIDRSGFDVIVDLVKNRGLNPLWLDMANKERAGGGTETGACAYEEEQCRRSDLLRRLQTIPYPMRGEESGVYVPNVPLLRAGKEQQYDFLSQQEQCSVSFGAVAAYHLQDRQVQGDRIIDGDVVKRTKSRFRTFCDMAILNGHDALVLGAWGCGAFRNPPQHMVQLMQDVIEKHYKGCFQLVVYAVIDDHNARKEGNFGPFARAILARGGKAFRADGTPWAENSL
jgi:uncharacterized protein (TIGR02452 family)